MAAQNILTNTPSRKAVPEEKPRKPADGGGLYLERDLHPLTGRRVHVFPGVRHPAQRMSENTLNVRSTRSA